MLKLDAVLSAATLPALPQSAIRVLEVTRDPRCAPAQLAEPIEADGALAAQVLRFVNSSYFGFRHEISSVRQGVALVGLRAIKNFVLWTALFTAIPDPKCGGFSLKEFRGDALRRGLFAKLLASLLNVDDVDEVFTAALLQDIAVPLLAKELGTPYSALLGRRDDGRERLSRLERDTVGWSHAEAAAKLFEQWHLPGRLGGLVLSHTDAERLLAQPAPPANAVAVALSSLLPAASDPIWHEAQCLASCWKKLPITDQVKLPCFLATVDQSYDSLTASHGMDGTADSLVARYEEACLVSTEAT